MEGGEAIAASIAPLEMACDVVTPVASARRRLLLLLSSASTSPVTSPRPTITSAFIPQLLHPLCSSPFPPAPIPPTPCCGTYTAAPLLGMVVNMYSDRRGSPASTPLYCE